MAPRRQRPDAPVTMLGSGSAKGQESRFLASTASRRAGELSEDLHALLKPQKPRKYHNQPVTVDGVTFDSTREHQHYLSLLDDLLQGKIRDLEVHPRFPLVVHGQDCGDYIGDFAYLDSEGNRIVEDVKSAATRKLAVYRLKAKLVWALYGIKIQEV